MDHGQKIERKGRSRIALGASMIAMGTSFQVLGFTAHNVVAQMIIRGSSIFITIIGIVIMVVAINEAKKAKESEEKSE